MAKIFNRVATDSADTTQLIQVINGGQRRAFPPGFFAISHEKGVDTSAAHGKITLTPVNGNRLEVIEFESSSLQDKDGNGFSDLDAALEYLFGFFFDRPGGVSSGGGSSLPYVRDITPASDNVHVLRLIPSQITPTTEAGDGNGPYITAGTDIIRAHPFTIGDSNNASGDGFVVADGGASFQKVGTGTAKVTFDTDRDASGDKLLSPWKDGWFNWMVVLHQSTPGTDLVIINAGTNRGFKRENIGGKLNLKVNEVGFDIATYAVTTNGQSIELAQRLGNAGWQAGQMYFIGGGRTIDGSHVAAVGLIDDANLDMSKFACRAAAGTTSQFEDADGNDWNLNLDQNEKLFEWAIGVGPWSGETLADAYRYAVETYGPLA